MDQALASVCMTVGEEQQQPDVAGAGDRFRESANLPPPAAKAALPIVIGVVIVFVILVVVVVQTGVFDKDTSASDATIVAGMLTLLGGLIASAFTLVGLLLKHSIDRHSARLAQEAERSRRLEAREAESRLRLETSIKAVELLTMPDGQAAPRARQAGALFVLGSHPLQQLDLAVALLNESWEAGKISSSAAVWVIDRALKQDDESLQEGAAWTLQSHAKLLPNTNGDSLEWPDCADLRWPTGASYFARTTLVRACAAALAERGPADWDKGTVNWFIAEFDLIQKTDKDPEVQSGATLVLDVLLDWYLRQDPAGTILLPEGPVRLAGLRADLAQNVEPALRETSEQMWNLVAKLRADWGYGTQEQSSAEVSTRVPARADAKPL